MNLSPAQKNMLHKLEVCGAVYDDTMKGNQLSTMKALESKGLVSHGEDADGDPCWQLRESSAVEKVKSPAEAGPC